MRLLTTTSELNQACAQFQTSRYVTIDTEFLREKTFWPKLCLIQIAMPGFEALIDPLAEGIDMSGFFEILKNPDILKVMHGCRQDIEIFQKEAGIIPSPMMDTQVMAMVCGYGDSISYEALVRRIAHGTIDKGSRFTDWSRRPLNNDQLTYAIADVTYLRDIFENLENDLKKTGRLAWLSEEMHILTNPETYNQSPENAWKRLKYQDKRPHIMGVVIELAKWREIQAQTRDLPRNRILKDDAIREIALQNPKKPEDFDKMRSVPKGFISSRNAAGLMEAIEAGRKLTKKDLPPAPPVFDNRPGIGPLVDLLKVLLKYCCEENQVAPKLIANVTDLERIASDDNPDVKCMEGWRKDVFGAAAMDLKNGRLALASENDRILIIKRD